MIILIITTVYLVSCIFCDLFVNRILVKMSHIYSDFQKKLIKKVCLIPILNTGFVFLITILFLRNLFKKNSYGN